MAVAIWGGTSNGLITTGFAGFDGDSLGQSGGSQAVQEHSHSYDRLTTAVNVESGVNHSVPVFPAVTSATTTFDIGDSQNVQPSLIANYLMVL
ncbi:MAG: hypothetical protein AAF228_13345 [Pseudomonadota bacterium]